MSPPDSERSSILPTLTWESIVDRDPNADGDAASASAIAAPPAPPAPPVPPPPALGARPVAVGTPDAQVGPMSLSLHPGDVPPPPPPPPAPPVPPAPVGGSPAGVLPSDDFRVSFPSLGIDEAPANAATGAVSELAEETGLPTIREATPVPPYVSDDVPVMAPPSTGSDTTIVAAIDSGATPMVPGSQPGPIVLPPATQPDQSARAAAAAAMSPLAVEIPQRKPVKRKRARTGLRLVMMLVVLGAIVAGAIVFGRPYLFPDDWAANASPYAEAVEQVTGSAFAEPLTVTAEPTADYETRMTTQITGDWSTQLPMWRSLGLATGDVTDASLATLLAGWQPAQYSTTDGQIYHDDALTGSSLEAQLTMAMATAWLDQDFGWALGQPDRTLDAAAMVSAEVLAQSTAILRASEYDTELASPPTGPLAYLPAVISYEALAPAMYAPLLPPVAADGPNPLADLSASPVGGWVDAALEPATPATLVAGDVAVGSPATMDRSFWYLVFAGFVDAPTAYAASESIVESSLTVADRAGTTCAYATFSGGDMIQTPALRAAMESWVATLPPTMAGAFSVGADGGLQMVSCDPGAQQPPQTRLGAATELIGWRSAELATIAGVLAAGGGDAEIGAALDRLAVSDVGAGLASTAVDQSPAAAAEAAKIAVEPIVSPPPPPVVEPVD